MNDSAIATLTRWAAPSPEHGPAVYRLTGQPAEHKHAYHVYCPWSPDQRQLLLLRYDKVEPTAEVCVMDTADGSIRAVGRTSRWGCHNAARQQWVGDRIYYHAAPGPNGNVVTGGPEGVEDTGEAYVTVAADGSGERTVKAPGITAPIATVDGRWVYGGTPLATLFPDDAIAPREDKGLFRVNLETGERELVLSLADALAVLPDAEQAAKCHLYLKMFVIHPKRDRILFNLTNTFWDSDGTEPVIRQVVSCGLDGSNPAWVGSISHHPNWHPLDNTIIANAPDCNRVSRMVIYPGDGDGFVDYTPRTKGSGHPSYSHDGRWICTDAAGPDGDGVIFCDPQSGQSVTALRMTNYGGGSYRGFAAVKKRPAGQTVTEVLKQAASAEAQTWQTQCHPAWSRDGSAVLINLDCGEGSQLYAIDVAAAVQAIA